MNTITVSQVITSVGRDVFIKLPFTLYKADAAWVPPLNFEQKEFLSKKNPFLQHSSHALFIALKSDRPVGRIAVAIDQAKNVDRENFIAYFGWYESIDDQNVAKALFDHAKAWGEDKGATRFRGPLNFTMNHTCGLLVDGIREMPAINMPYNPPYYETLFLNCGLSKAKDLFAYRFDVDKAVRKRASHNKAVAQRAKNNGLSIRPLNMSGKGFLDDLETIRNIFNEAWKDNWGFTPIAHEEFLFLSKPLKLIVNPKLCPIVESHGEPVAFALTLPDLNPVLKALNGKLITLSWLTAIRRWRNIRRARLMTLGIKPSMRHSTVGALLFSNLLTACQTQGVNELEASWMLEDNLRIIMPLLGATEADYYSTHRIYEYKI